MVEHWDDEEFDIDDWRVAILPKVDDVVHTARVLLGEADPDALTEFDRLHQEGWADDPPHWSGDRLRAFSEAAGRIPDLAARPGGYWELSDETVTELTPKLPWSSRYVESPVSVRRESIKAEWLNARQLHVFLARALAAGNEVIPE
jgi:hypothetical protein